MAQAPSPSRSPPKLPRLDPETIPRSAWVAIDTGSRASSCPPNPLTTDTGKSPMKINGKAIELATTGAR